MIFGIKQKLSDHSDSVRPSPFLCVHRPFADLIYKKDHGTLITFSYEDTYDKNSSVLQSHESSFFVDTNKQKNIFYPVGVYRNLLFLSHSFSLFLNKKVYFKPNFIFSRMLYVNQVFCADETKYRKTQLAWKNDAFTWLLIRILAGNSCFSLGRKDLNGCTTQYTYIFQNS